jgi:hypothetical protein
VTSISRTDAPTVRSWVHDLRTLRLPPVNCAPRGKGTANDASRAPPEAVTTFRKRRRE